MPLWVNARSLKSERAALLASGPAKRRVKAAVPGMEAGSALALAQCIQATDTEAVMPKYLLQVNCTAEGDKGVIKDGGAATARTTVLMSADERDKASERTPTCKPPGNRWAPQAQGRP
ncbi:MAG: hypothetical protein Q8N44_16790 [Rubrivivax sp.]|nr:hypothetical protein [Rubrivivax sp.]